MSCAGSRWFLTKEPICHRIARNCLPLELWCKLKTQPSVGQYQIFSIFLFQAFKWFFPLCLLPQSLKHFIDTRNSIISGMSSPVSLGTETITFVPVFKTFGHAMFLIGCRPSPNFMLGGIFSLALEPILSLCPSWNIEWGTVNFQCWIWAFNIRRWHFILYIVLLTKWTSILAKVLRNKATALFRVRHCKSNKEYDISKVFSSRNLNQ